MTAILHILAWEWINIALECTATAWVRLPRFPLAVAGVNLVTHPLLMALLARWGRSSAVVLPCEAVIVLAEWGMLGVLYRTQLGRGEGPTPPDRPSRLQLFSISLLMNSASYGTGLLLTL